MNRPLIRALRAIRQLIQDPSRTEEVFTVVRNLDPGRLHRLHARMQRSAAGRELLRDRPSLLPWLADREALEAMPDGSLGRAYLAFCHREGIDPDGLVMASTVDNHPAHDIELRWIDDRIRDTHDLWHVVLGCRTDIIGELSVLAFGVMQTRNRGIAALVLTGFLRSFEAPELGRRLRRLLVHALLRGRRAVWLPEVRWEELLPLPIAEVRKRLSVTPLPAYTPFYMPPSADQSVPTSRDVEGSPAQMD